LQQFSLSFSFLHPLDANPMVEAAQRIVQHLQCLDTDRSGKIPRRQVEEVLRRLDPLGQWTSAKVGKLLTAAGLGSCEAAGDAVAYEKLVHWLLDIPAEAAKSCGASAVGHCPSLPSAAPRPRPIKACSSEEREYFLIEKWSPFLATLGQYVEDVKTRAARKFQLHEIMPSHAEIHSLVQTCLKLTKEWHGRGNISAVYEAFMEMAQYDGHTIFRFDTLQQARSPDGYIRLVDGRARYKAQSEQTARAKGTEASKKPVLIGRMVQAAGESPIDNLVLPSIMPRKQALLLFTGHRIQQFFVRALQWKQRRLLAASPASIGEELKASLAYRMLIELGGVIESYGQLPEDVRANADSFLASEIGARQGDTQVEEMPGELDEFIRHCQSHPGRAYKKCRVQHNVMLFKAIASKAVRVVWRSDLEPFTQHRYFVYPWTRTVPLLGLVPCEGVEDGGSRQGAGGHRLVELRPGGAKEVTRYRKNIFAYGEAHGLGQSGGGCAERCNGAPGRLRFELGTLLCEDEAAKVQNHWVTDIEKIIHDCVLTCPHGGEADALPGEVLHDGGQNPTIASSIGLTQHTQVMGTSAADFPLVLEQNKPMWRGDLNATVDVVQVGAEPDAFFVKFLTKVPDNRCFVKYLVDFRTHLMQTYGRGVDFCVCCFPTASGDFIVTFAPIASIKRVAVPKGTGILGLDFDFENPDLNKRFMQLDLPAAFVDCSHGKGNIVAITENAWERALKGRPKLVELYDFNRKVGAREVVEAFLNTTSSL